MAEALGDWPTPTRSCTPWPRPGAPWPGRATTPGGAGGAWSRGPGLGAAGGAGRRDRRAPGHGVHARCPASPASACTDDEVVLTADGRRDRRPVARPAAGRGGRRAEPAHRPGRPQPARPQGPGSAGRRGPTTCGPPWSGCWPPGRPAIAALEALDQRHLLERYLPEWAAVRNKPQRNPYHRFTVDRHLLEATANAATLAHRVRRADLLLLGTLLHDIGKGFPGDHTEVGHGRGRRHRHPDGPPARGRRHPRDHGPAPPPAARHRHPAGPRRPGHRRAGGRRGRRPVAPSSCWPPWSRPTAWPPGPRPGARGRPAWWPTWSSGPAACWPASRSPRRRRWITDDLRGGHGHGAHPRRARPVHRRPHGHRGGPGPARACWPR